MTATALTTAEEILYEVRGSTAIISLNRPARSNAQTYPLLYQLDAAFRRALDDDDVGAIVLRGEGKHFSAGHDTTAGDITKWERAEQPRRMSWPPHGNMEGAERQYAAEQEFYLGMCRRWRDIAKPTVAAVQGACIAGGMMLAWICDFIVASDDAFFADNTVDLGVPGVEYFAHAFELPPRIAREFLMLGERMPAKRAYELAMVNRLVSRDDLLTEALAMAEKLAAKPRFAMTLAKQACNHVDDLQGKRSAMEGVFAMHQLAHAHNRAVTGRSIILPEKK
ncbi:MAG: enoyl-CoA hydratase [Novosphingobium sp.]